MSTPKRCRSCGAAVVWANTPKGKMAIFDAMPQPGLSKGYRIKAGTAVFVGDADPSSGEELYTSHWATCLTAAVHKKPKASPQAGVE